MSINLLCLKFYDKHMKNLMHFWYLKKTFLLFRLFNYCKIRCFSPRKFYVFCQLPSLSNIDFYDTVRILGLQNHDYNENMCKYQLNEPSSIKSLVLSSSYGIQTQNEYAFQNDKYYHSNKSA